MGLVCQVCDHKRVHQINRELVSGKSLARIGREYSLPYESLRNHKNNHLTRQLAVWATEKDRRNSLDVLDRLQTWVGNAEDVLADAKSRGHNQLVLNALKVLLAQAELIAKIQHAIHQAQAEGADVDPEELAEFREWKKQQESILEIDQLDIDEFSPEAQQLLFEIQSKRLGTDVSPPTQTPPKRMTRTRHSKPETRY